MFFISSSSTRFALYLHLFFPTSEFALSKRSFTFRKYPPHFPQMTTHHKHALSLPPPHPRQTLSPALHTFAPPSRRSSHGCKVKQRARRGLLMSISCKLESHRSIINGERNVTRIFSAFDGDNGYISGSVRKRKVVEHILLLKAKSDLLEDEEKNMLDYLFTTQYQMSGTLALSLGRIEDQNADGFSHAMFMRFQRKEDLAKYYKNSYYSGVLKEHVMPHCYVCPDMGLFLWITNLK
ncbi:hypothetical protein QJS10_CPA06g00373 [Acorus calamus]|uniref:Stress-response A/B barrel domain-containing protein n=1 Tax=Acorus calamus TaxID=4465 RepID=A0AAV9ENE3_ACOCL|nr:hypothetical protein QJS10_CPA06g00373 [Acorus calamus]